jgi:hypothetical protein
MLGISPGVSSLSQLNSALSTFKHQTYLIAFGGNTGTVAVNDVWCLNVDKAPFSWLKLETPGDIPNIRVYHSAAMCHMGSATGMMVIFGGRTAD